MSDALSTIPAIRKLRLVFMPLPLSLLCLACGVAGPTSDCGGNVSLLAPSSASGHLMQPSGHANRRSNGAGRLHNDVVRSIGRHLEKHLPTASSGDRASWNVMFKALSDAVDEDSRERGVPLEGPRLEIATVLLEEASRLPDQTPELRRLADSLRTIPGVVERLDKLSELRARASHLARARMQGGAFMMQAQDTLDFILASEAMLSSAADTTTDVYSAISANDDTVAHYQGIVSSDTALQNRLNTVADIADSSLAFWDNAYQAAWLESVGTLYPQYELRHLDCSSLNGGGAVVTPGGSGNLFACPWCLALFHGTAHADIEGAEEGILVGLVVGPEETVADAGVHSAAQALINGVAIAVQTSWGHSLIMKGVNIGAAAIIYISSHR